MIPPLIFVPLAINNNAKGLERSPEHLERQHGEKQRRKRSTLHSGWRFYQQALSLVTLAQILGESHGRASVGLLLMVVWLVTHSDPFLLHLPP